MDLVCWDPPYGTFHPNNWQILIKQTICIAIRYQYRYGRGLLWIKTVTFRQHYLVSQAKRQATARNNTVGITIILRFRILISAFEISSPCLLSLLFLTNCQERHRPKEPLSCWELIRRVTSMATTSTIPMVLNYPNLLFPFPVWKKGRYPHHHWLEHNASDKHRSLAISILPNL